MNNLPYIVFGASLFIPVVQYILIRRTRRMQGHDAPVTNPLIEAMLQRHGQVILYFYTPQCDACQVMETRINRLTAKHENIIKLNARDNKEMAKRLKLVATPSVVHLKNGKISKIIAGITSEKQIAALLN